MDSKKNRVGRPGAAEVARNLLSLAASLSEQGDFVSVEATEKRLGCSPAQARKLYALLTNIAANPGGIAAYEDEEGLVMGAGGSRGRALRLDAKETIALVSALQRLGVEEDHPLRAKLQGSLAEGAADAALISRMLAAKPDAGDTRTLTTCTGAIAALRDLTFEYRKPDAAPELRRVRPERLSQEDGFWYLHGLDLDKRAERVFRMDRMAAVADVARNGDGDLGSAADAPEVRRVRLAFRDRRFLALFAWPGLELEEGPDANGDAVGTLPYYGGMWLPRQVAGCGGMVSVDDAEVASLARSYARELLSNAE